MTDSFERILAVDWSGAMDTRSIAVAAHRQNGQVQLVAAPVEARRRWWSRGGIFSLLLSAARSEGRTLAGLDFPFAMPLPIQEQIACATAADLWAFVEAAAAGAPDFYGRPSAEAPQWQHCFHRGGTLASQPDVQLLLRETEEACKRAKLGQPWSTLRLSSQPAGVQALAGMRLLHALREALGPALAVWPFDDVDAPGVRLVVVEIFPRTAIPRELAGLTKVSLDHLPKVLAHHGASLIGAPAVKDHDTDALVAAAALPKAWRERRHLRELPAQASREGWILGVGP
jgi:hypothetical protein